MYGRYMLQLITPLLLAAVAPAAEQGAGTVTVPLEKRLLADPILEVAELQPVPGEMPEGLQAFATTLPFRKGVRVRVVLMERKGAKPVWMIDKNLDGELSADEQIEVTDQPTIVEFPLEGELFPSFPILVKAVRLPPNWQADMLRKNVRLLYYSHSVDVATKVALDGVPYDFFYRVSSNTFDAALTKTWLAVDIDRDGKIDQDRWSDEMVNALGQPAVFKIGSHYMRTDAVDTKAMTAVVREVDASEYRLISMRAGRVLPDFPFVDLDGAPRDTRTERGARYTMLYFWGTWCPICVSELPNFDEANRKFRDRGFRVIGINQDKDPEVARKFLKDRNVSFPQARWDSVEDLVDRRFRIDEWPTAILVDADMRVVSTNSKGELHIRQGGLIKTLEGLLSGAKSSPDTKPNEGFRPPPGGHR